MDEIIIDNHLGRLTSEALRMYYSHVVCNGGMCRFLFNGQPFTLNVGDSMIIIANRLVTDIQPSHDFMARVVYVSPELIQESTPTNNYHIKGAISLYNNPIMPLLPEEHDLLNNDISQLERRLQDEDKYFFRDILINLLQVMYIDFFEFHRRINDKMLVSERANNLMNSFLRLLETGIYRKERHVGYYADKLFITPKYLSEVTCLVSGQPAAYWINRFTIIDINNQLKEKTLSLSDIASQFNFSSMSYFSRFVQKYLGMSPSDIRKKS
ncbi:MAG: AraC family transcriptional regulator [Prevotella sp.]|nr:AraC family transcriptional regulator [Prevotella sp.]